jgi:VWFA-related protein
MSLEPFSPEALMRRFFSRTALTGVLAATLLTAAGSAQQATFRAGVEMVVIDVNVVQTPSWVPIGDLKPEDFTVTVDRQPRNIVSATYVSHGTARLGQLSADAMGGADPSGTGPVNDIGRHVLIAVDEESLETGDVVMARNAIRQMVDRLAPAERIGVVAVPHLPSTMTFTTDRPDVYKAIGKVGLSAVPGPPIGEHNVGLWEALEMERNVNAVAEEVIRRECGGAGTAADPHVYETCVADVTFLARTIALQAKTTTTRSHDALRAIGEALREIQGPKILVLVSGGLATPESEHELAEVETQLAAAQATLYTIYIEKSIMPSLARRQSPSFFDDRRIERMGIENLTGAVGGTFIHVIGKIQPTFDRVALEMSGTYLLGIEVLASDRDGTPHFVDVKVKRPDVEVRARRRYVIPRERPLARPVTDSSLLNAVLKAGPPSPTPAGPRAPVTVPVMSPELKALLVKAGEYVTACEVQFVTLAADEAYEETVSRMKLTRTGDSAEWIAEKRRTLNSDYLLARAPLLAGWLPYRDVYAVDGKAVRKRDARLAQLFASPATAYDRAKKLSEESNRYDIGFIDRNVNQPMTALVFLKHLNRERFTFIKEGEDVIEGISAWRIAFAERDSPTFIQGEGGDLPADGVVWIDPGQGRVLKTTVRLNVEPVATEITVTYRPNPAFGELWVPSEMREVYAAPAIKVECTARYTNVRTLGGGAQ